MEKVTHEDLNNHELFANVDPSFADAIEAAYFGADEYMCKFLEQRNHLYWLTLYTVKVLYLKSVVFFDYEILTKFIFVQKNKILFEAYYFDNNKNLKQTANLIARKFSESYGMKPYTEGISSLFKNERADQNFFEYKIVNHSSELGLTIEDFLNEYGKQGWEFVTVKNNSYFFKRTIIDDFLYA